MKVIVDTCVWSSALRRHPPKPNPVIDELQKLIEDSRVQMLGPIRQELLSGIASPSQFLKLKTDLSAFPDLAILTDDYETAARYFNTCRAKGIQGSAIDFLICAMATRHESSIFTTDKDFISYSKLIPIELHEI